MRASRVHFSDGGKMSTSYDNAIYLADGPPTVSKKVDSMLTDPQRTHRHIPGDPGVCPVFDTHRMFSPRQTVDWADRGCRTAEIACCDCKKALKESLSDRLTPINERRSALEADPGRIEAVLRRGSEAARAIAAKALSDVRRAMQIKR
jgi:tryptophanyl-tRNA synthetase